MVMDTLVWFKRVASAWAMGAGIMAVVITVVAGVVAAGVGAIVELL